MRIGANRGVTGNHDVRFQAHTITEANAATDMAIRANMHIGTDFNGVLNNSGRVNVAQALLLAFILKASFRPTQINVCDVILRTKLGFSAPLFLFRWVLRGFAELGQKRLFAIQFAPWPRWGTTDI